MVGPPACRSKVRTQKHSVSIPKLSVLNSNSTNPRIDPPFFLKSAGKNLVLPALEQIFRTRTRSPGPQNMNIGNAPVRVESHRIFVWEFWIETKWNLKDTMGYRLGGKPTRRGTRRRFYKLPEHPFSRVRTHHWFLLWGAEFGLKPKIPQVGFRWSQKDTSVFRRTSYWHGRSELSDLYPLSPAGRPTCWAGLILENRQ